MSDDKYKVVHCDLRGQKIIENDFSGAKYADTKNVCLLLNEQAERIAELEDILQDTHRDLLVRADKDSDGTKVADISHGIWLRIKGAINP